MPYVSAAAKTQLRNRLDDKLGAAVDVPGGQRRQDIVDAICDWLGSDVLPVLQVDTTVSTTVATTVVGACSTGPLTGSGTGTGTGTGIGTVS
jgi:hypothetical protein